MTTAPARTIITAEAVGAIAAGALLMVWTGAAAAGLRLPAVPASWAVVRLVAVVVVCFGALLWAVRDHASRSRAVLWALTIGHAVAAFFLLLQQFAIWTNGFGSAVALIPLGLAFRYAQHAHRSEATDALASSTVG